MRPSDIANATLSPTWARTWLAWGMGIFFAAFLLLPDHLLNNIFYVFALPPSLFFLYRQRADIVRSKEGLAIVILLLYLASSSYWADNGALSSFIQSIKHIIYLACFLTGVSALYSDEKNFWRFIQCVLIAACVGFAVNLWSLINTHGLNGRLAGLVGPSNSVDLGVAYGLAALLAAACYINEQRLRWLSAILFLVLVSALLLTQTRVAISAFCAALGVLLLYNLRQREGVILLIAVTSLMIAGVAFGHFDRFQRALDTSAGIFARISIWQEIFETVREKSLIFGMGQNSPIALSVEELSRRPFKTTHNLYMGTFYFGGVIALILMMGTLLYSFAAAYKWARLTKNMVPLSLLAYAALASLAHGTELLNHPVDVWFFWWLPVGIALHVAKEMKTASTQLVPP